MRRWLLLAMILLLPLRGLAGEAMAAQMLERHVLAAASGPAGHHHVQHGGHHAQGALHDCADQHRPAGAAGHAQPKADGDTAETEGVAAQQGPTGDCPTCASCQVCSSVVMHGAVPIAPAAQVQHARPLTAERAPPSAEAALAFKPPRG